MTKFEINRIIRSKLFDAIKVDSSEVVILDLSLQEYFQELKNILVITAAEMIQVNNRLEMIEKLADIIEVIHAVCQEHKSDIQQLFSDSLDDFAKTDIDFDNCKLSSLLEEFYNNIKEINIINHSKDIGKILCMIFTICIFNEIPLSEIEEVRKSKLEKQGGFEQKVKVISANLNDNHPAIPIKH